MALTAGMRLGPYEVLSPLGAGGMGEVYLALDTRLGRKVAIKAILNASSSGRRAQQLVLQEARAAAALVHPGIAAIHDVIEVDGSPMIVMEYVPGESLDAHVQRQPASIAQVVDWGVQIADALESAHANGIVHCDIKPANIRVTTGGGLKVLDFGVARIRSVVTIGGEPERPTTAITTASTPSVGGTPPYMAPEQILSQPVDARTDVYAMGVVLFELLGGRRPFVARDRLELTMQVLSAPTPLVTDVNPAVPQDLSAIVSRAMARLPADRYPSAAALGLALRDTRAHLTTDRRVEVSPTAPEAPRRFTTRATAAVVAVVALAAIIAAGVWWRVGRSPVTSVTRSRASDPVVAVLPLRNLSGESQNDFLSAGVTDVVISKLAALPGARVLATNATSRYRDGADRVERAARELGATLVVDGSLQRSGNRLLIAASLLNAGSGEIVWSGTFNALVDDVFGLQRQLTAGLIQGLQDSGAYTGGLTARDRARLAGPPTANVDAFANYAQGRSFLERFDVAANLDRATALLQAAIARDPKFALAHAALGETFWQQYQRTRDQSWIVKARDETLEALRLDPEQAGVRYSLAVIYNGTGRSAEAIEELQRAIALQPAGDDAHRLLGEIIAKAGDVDRAVRELQLAVELRPSYWANHFSLGIALYNAGRYKDAIPPLTRVTELQPDSTRGFQALGTVYHQSGDLANALVNYQRAIQITPTAGAYSNIGTIHYGRGQFDEAARAYEQAVALGPASAPARRNLGDAYEALGEAAKAREAYTMSLELSRKALTVNPRDVRTLALQAFCEAKLGMKDAAQRDIKNAIAIAPTDKEVLYKRAVVRALTGDSTGALAALDEALAHGYSAALVTADRDLQSLRGSAEFERLIRTPR